MSCNFACYGLTANAFEYPNANDAAMFAWLTKVTRSVRLTTWLGDVLGAGTGLLTWLLTLLPAESLPSHA